MAKDPYQTFARRYDAFRIESPERRTFFAQLFEEHDVRRLLDCACGTGADLVTFHSMGIEVVGSDVSEAMLDRARERLAEAFVDVPLYRCDFRELDGTLGDSFDAVVCLSTSLPHLHEEEEILRALQSMRAVLRPGGILVLDQGMTDRQWAEQPRFLPAIDRPDLSRLMAIDYDEDRFVVHVLDFAGAHGERTFHHDTFTYRRLLRDDYAQLLGDTGFARAEFCGGFDRSAYNKTLSRRLIAVAEA